MERTPVTDQACYDLGYDNPSKPFRDYEWRHVVLVNAYHAGQMDRQNHAPRNRAYDRDEYDPVTGERNSPGASSTLITSAWENP